MIQPLVVLAPHLNNPLFPQRWIEITRLYARYDSAVLFGIMRELTLTVTVAITIAMAIMVLLLCCRITCNKSDLSHKIKTRHTCTTSLRCSGRLYIRHGSHLEKVGGPCPLLMQNFTLTPTPASVPAPTSGSSLHATALAPIVAVVRWNWNWN